MIGLENEKFWAFFAFQMQLETIDLLIDQITDCTHLILRCLRLLFGVLKNSKCIEKLILLKVAGQCTTVSLLIFLAILRYWMEINNTAALYDTRKPVYWINGHTWVLIESAVEGWICFHVHLKFSKISLLCWYSPFYTYVLNFIVIDLIHPGVLVSKVCLGAWKRSYL